MQQEDKTLTQENIDAVLKYMDMSPRDALKVEAAKIMRALRKSEEEIRNSALEEAAECVEDSDDKLMAEFHADRIRSLKTTAPSQGEKQNG